MILFTGASLEQTHIFALAHILRRPIIVYGVKYVKSFRGESLGLARFQGNIVRYTWLTMVKWLISLSSWKIFWSFKELQHFQFMIYRGCVIWNFVIKSHYFSNLYCQLRNAKSCRGKLSNGGTCIKCIIQYFWDAKNQLLFLYSHIL